MSNFANVRYRLHNLVVLSSNGSLEYFPSAACQALLRALAYPLANPETLAACRADLERLRATART